MSRSFHRPFEDASLSTDAIPFLSSRFYVLRDEMLSFLINSLASDLSLPEPPWEEIEASLHCLRAAQEAVPEDENTFLPRFFSPEILGRLPTAGDSRTRATTLALLGESSFETHKGLFSS